MSQEFQNEEEPSKLRKVKWTRAYRKLNGKDMTKDATFEFERKRNRPERYDRNKMEEALKAIPVIDEIGGSRADKHIARRLSGKKGITLKRARSELDHDLIMVQAPDPISNLQTEKRIKISTPQTQEKRAMEE